MTETTDLSTLTDRDLLGNLWVQIIMLIEHADIDAERIVSAVLRLEADAPCADGQTTLAALLAEVEARLNISAVEYHVTMEAVQ